ncbi:tandem-95 repeat protein [Sulfitobacter sp. JB4-11]|uniref:tandem-95 repeat protein n=1 Tax=Sulfitobacter rhodophyticola TaxID=3238304 RepID=UPI00351207BD
MIRTLDFNAFAAGTVVDTEYADEGVTISATGGSGKAMIFDSANPTGGDNDLASDTLGGLLIISEDGDSSDPDDNWCGGTIAFDFDGPVRIKKLTFKDIEETSGEGTYVRFLDDEGNVIDEQFIGPTRDGGESTVQFDVPGTSRFEVVFSGSGAIDNLVFEDNSAPDAVDDCAVTDEDTAVIIPVLDNDTDPNGDVLTVTEATSPDGTVEITPEGALIFTPAENFNGNTSITYSVDDGNGGTDTATVSVIVNPINDAPDAVDDADSTDEDTAITVDLLANDADVDGDPMSVVAATVPAEQGTLVDNGDGTVTFTPAPDFAGEATISYTIEDPEGLQDSALHTITVVPVDDAPVAEDDAAETDEDTPVTVDVLANDSDPDGDPLTVTEATSPDGTVEITPEGLVFTPAENFNGPTTISYTVQDPDGNEDTATVAVNVVPVNDAPDAVDDSDETPFETAVTVDLLANDSDVDGDDLSVIEATVPGEQGTLVNNGDGTVTFTPAAGFAGTATIAYTIADEEGLTDSAIHTVTVADPVRDGFVDGTDDGDLIDVDYLGDPDGDLIDAGDAILPGTEGDDDFVRAGDGDDTVIAGQGSDTVQGGEGDDDITTGNGDLAPDLGYPEAATDTLGFDPDTDPEDDRDSVDGGAGNDTISTGDDRDTIDGGTGEDVINAGIDDDIVDAGEGADRVVGGEGNDVIFGGAGDDTLYGGNDPDLGLDVLDIPDEPTADNPFSPDRNPDNGRDTIEGGAGNDVIFGADDDDFLLGGTGDDTIDGQVDDDQIDGGAGDDLLMGGQGDDTIEGGDGNDDIRGGEGDDVLFGDAGEDTFSDVNAGDEVDGGEGPVDNDTLDLRGSAPAGGSLAVTYTSDDLEDGIVNYFDEDGNDAGSLVFEEIENVIPCFTPGTKIATPKGERLVEDLKVGDRIITRDNGMQEIRWIGARGMTGAEFEQAAHLKPVLIRQGALGNDLPERDMMVSPNHRVLIANDKTALFFEEREVLVAAKHLTHMEGIDVVDVSHTTYIHILFDHHEVILSDGTWTESFQPGDMSLAGIGDAQRGEILELFPELATKQGIDGYTSARRSLKKHEAKLLSK